MSDEPEYTIDAGRATLKAVLVTCKCGRKLLAEAFAYMARTVPQPHATCLDCLEVDPKFREEYPDVAAKIDGWKDGSQ